MDADTLATLLAAAYWARRFGLRQKRTRRRCGWQRIKAKPTLTYREHQSLRWFDPTAAEQGDQSEVNRLIYDNSLDDARRPQEDR